MKKLLIFILGLAFLSMSDNEPQLVEKDTGAMIKASYIYNFAKLVGWPESRKKGNFSIGVLGDASLYQQLITKYSGKQIAGQPIEIMQMADPENLSKPHILFVSRKHNDQLDVISKQLARTNTMVITESDKGLAQGASLNFVVVENVLKFEISEANAAAHKLIIGTTLKSLAYTP